MIGMLLPKVIGTHADPHTWHIHEYKGIGKLPTGLSSSSDPAKRALLNQLPRIIRGYGRTPGIDAVVVVLDTDQRDCAAFLSELKAMLRSCNPAPKTIFRLAIEEMESWFLGDKQAIFSAYPRARRDILSGYQQDSICGTWELLADAVHPGGSATIIKAGWPLPGEIKHAWAEKICPKMDIEINQSPSFRKFRDGIRKLIEDIKCNGP